MSNRRYHAWGICSLGLLACLTGCQVSIGGQTIPSPYYQFDDVQYFPAGHEFMLQNEADALNAQNAPPAIGGAAEVGARPQPPAPAAVPTRR